VRGKRDDRDAGQASLPVLADVSRKKQPLTQLQLDATTYGVAPPRTDAERTAAYIAEKGFEAYERERRYCTCGKGDRAALRRHKKDCRMHL